MPTPARKFLYAGKSGLNITHAEERALFVQRYRPQHPVLLNAIRQFDNTKVKRWVEELGIETFTGSSGRVFPAGMKAAPLLRNWLQRMSLRGLKLHTRHRWHGWDTQGHLLFSTPTEVVRIRSKSLLLALGGGSWQRLGSNQEWLPVLEQQGVQVRPIQPANCGFLFPWPSEFITRFAGTPIKGVQISVTDSEGAQYQSRGDLMISQTGLEGGLIYGVAHLLRDQIDAQGDATLTLDLLPARTQQELEQALSARGRRSVSQVLKNYRLSPVKQALLQLLTSKSIYQNPIALAGAIKQLPLTLMQTQPLDRAISTAGGVGLDQLDHYLMACKQPGLFFAGEMLDWEAPTGGYLLTACLATGRQAAEGMRRFLHNFS